jgi:predicted RNase H-like nuclease (RuvC/YqgF family)
VIKDINEKIKEDNKVHLLESEVEILKIKLREAEAKVNLIQEKLQESRKFRITISH